MNPIELIKADGYCILEDVIPSDEVAEIRGSVLQTVASYRRNDSAATQIGFVPGLIAVDQSYADYLADERLLSSSNHCWVTT
jgi:hypothetical protein